MLLDYHIHLELDTYCEPLRLRAKTITSYLEQAKARGVSEIGISEHCYRFREFAPAIKHLGEGEGAHKEVRQFFAGLFIDQLSAYVEFILGLQNKGYPVKLGLEVDYVPGQEQTITNIISDYPWDYLLGSVHFLSKWTIDASPEIGWPERNVINVYDEYFRTWEQACRSGLFHSMAHPDLVKKFGHQPTEIPLSLYRSAAQTAAETGVAIEVSSAGLRKPIGEIYPGMALLREFYAQAVPITLGSDAHSVEDIGIGINSAATWARCAGYTQVARFTKGKYVQEPLG